MKTALKSPASQGVYGFKSRLRHLKGLLGGPRAIREALIRATAWTQAYLDGGRVVTRERATFAAFAAGFFDSEGQWVCAPSADAVTVQ